MSLLIFRVEKEMKMTADAVRYSKHAVEDLLASSIFLQ